MKTCFKSWLLRTAAPILAILSVSGLAQGAGPQYVMTNDDVSFPFLSSVSFYSPAPNGSLTLLQRVSTVGYGISGGFFGANRLAVLNSNGQHCVYSSEAGTGDIVGISVDTLTIGGRASGSSTDAGTSNGIGLVLNSQYLYASFTDSNTIGTFQIMSGCDLAFVGDLAVSGLAAGVINGMAIRGNMMVVTYTDGSIQSFNISAGIPVSNNDAQYSTATLSSKDATYPNAIDITSDGKFAIFGDTSTAEVVEVSNISSGKLTKTVVHKSNATISSSNIMLSPDETLLYVINTQGATISAYHFNKATGQLTPGCRSGPVSGQSANWSYLTGMGFASPSGNGGGVYVAEFSSTPAIALVTLTTSGGKCSLQEAPTSPYLDPYSQGLLSIGTFPPRAF